MRSDPLTTDELESQQAAVLPDRNLLLAVTVLGLPLVGLDGVNVNVDTSGPNWLAGAIGT